MKVQHEECARENQGQDGLRLKCQIEHEQKKGPSTHPNNRQSSFVILRVSAMHEWVDGRGAEHGHACHGCQMSTTNGCTEEEEAAFRESSSSSLVPSDR